MRAIAIILAGLVCAVVAWKVVFPTYTHRYRLTISIEVDGQVHTGSSVIEIAYVRQPELPSVGDFAPPRVRGQAPFVDLEQYGAVVAALHPGAIRNGSSNVTYLAMKAYGVGGGYEAYRTIAQQRGRRDLSADNMPLLIWFEKVGDPTTAQVLDPRDFSSKLGPDARLHAAYVEITDDPIQVDIDKKLPWYPELAERQRGNPPIQYPGHLELLRDLFVGADT